MSVSVSVRRSVLRRTTKQPNGAKTPPGEELNTALRLAFSPSQDAVLHRLRECGQAGALQHGRHQPHAAGDGARGAAHSRGAGPGEEAGVLGRRLPGLRGRGGLPRGEPAHHHPGEPGGSSSRFAVAIVLVGRPPGLPGLVPMCLEARHWFAGEMFWDIA